MTNYDRLLELVREAGMDKKWAKMFIKKLADDEAAFPVSEEKRNWALERGFYPGRTELYGLNEENASRYLPDYPYFMMHPLNHHFKIWVNDKLTLKYVLSGGGCADTMPEYYLYVENNGNYTYLCDAPEDVARDENFLLNLLRKKGTLAVKPNSGTSGGRGFMKLELRDGQLFENNRPISPEEFIAHTSRLENHIVTQYAYQHAALSEIWPESECTLRVIMLKEPVDKPYDTAKWRSIVSYARFGTSVSGGASNLSSGGIGVGFDFETGAFCDVGIRYKKFCPDGQWHLSRHPDTGVVWKNTSLPNWQFVKQKLLRVCSHISSLDYLGFDVIITPDGLKLCEINTHPAADYEQVMCGPVLDKKGAREFFTAKGMEKINTADFLRMYLACQEQ